MAKRNSAFFKAIGEAQQTAEEENTTIQNSETVSQSNFGPVPPLDSNTAPRLHLPTVEPARNESSAQGAGRSSSQTLRSSTASPHPRETVSQSHRSTVTAELNKTSFYLTQAQLDKLDELAYAYKRQTGRRINRNDIVRFLVDHARFETLLAEW